MFAKRIILTVFIAALFVSGCSRTEQISPAGARPHYANPAKDVKSIGRVIFIEPENLSANPQISIDLTNALSRAIERKNLFGQELVYRNDPVFTKYQLDCEKCPPETLQGVYKAFACDAILTGVIRDYRTYPHLAISLRLRLVDLRDGQLVWAMEQVWDSTDQELEKRMRGFFESQMSGGYEPLNWKLGLVSPNMFNKFVCYEIGETLTANSRNAEAVYRLERQ